MEKTPRGWQAGAGVSHDSPGVNQGFTQAPVSGAGYTLMELLIVIGVIAVVVASGVFGFQELGRRGRDSRRRADIQMFAGALEQYYLANDQQYPTDTSCLGTEAFLATGQFPSDPSADVAYDYDWAGSCDGATGSYCVCALMEVVGSGNAFGRTSAACDFDGVGDKNYFCIQSKQ